MYFSGFADEAGNSIETQIAATLALGWKNIESRMIDGVNIHDISERKFAKVCQALSDKNVRINCFGSTVANWAKDPLKDKDFEISIAELERAIRRMNTLDCKMIRGMSFKVLDAYEADIEKQIFKKVEYLAKMCEDAGVVYLHENCMNYGGMSYEHTLRLLDNIKSKAFKLVFDTGNAVFSYDRRGDKPYKIQNSWNFYKNIREFIHYVHVKDGIKKDKLLDSGFFDCEFTFPGEGEGCVKAILEDLVRSGYDGGISIEPHMDMVFHKKDETVSDDDFAKRCFATYVEYGKRTMQIIDRVKL